MEFAVARNHNLTRQPTRSQATYEALTQAAIEELDEVGELGLRLESVVERAGLSLGAVYHHFKDKSGLIDAARLLQITKDAEIEITAWRLALRDIRDYEHLMQVISELAALMYFGQRKGPRSRHLTSLAAALNGEKFGQNAAVVHHSVTAVLIELFEELKHRQILSDRVDTWSVATFLQAYFLGQAVAECDPSPVPTDRWRAVEMTVLTAMLPQFAESAPGVRPL
jgi:AcrR family transcriptional regulator